MPDDRWQLTRLARLTRLDPTHLRGLRFTRAPLGRRGLAPEPVYAFLRRVIDDLTNRDAVEATLRAENHRLRHALNQWRTGQVTHRNGTGRNERHRGRTGSPERHTSQS